MEMTDPMDLDFDGDHLRTTFGATRESLFWLSPLFGPKTTTTNTTKKSRRSKRKRKMIERIAGAPEAAAEHIALAGLDRCDRNRKVHEFEITNSQIR